MTNKELAEMPNPVVLIAETGLYTRFRLDVDKVLVLEEAGGPFDLYCTGCNSHSIFRRHCAITPPQVASGMPPALYRRAREQKAREQRVFVVELECSRDQNHKATFAFKVGSDFICKIGQFPSRADLDLPDIRKYEAILGKQFSELHRAIGLNAHGIGIGSFVYLRRILERLVDSAADQRREQEPSWDRAEWSKKRMSEKVKELEQFLPQFLVDNAAIYGIASKGIHELDEDECLKDFHVMKESICLILDQELARREEGRRVRSLTSEIAKMRSERSLS
jgi:hypothetical protein